MERSLTVKEFFEKFSNKYTDVTAEDIESIKLWFDQVNLSNSDLWHLYLYIAQNYEHQHKRSPSLKKIREMWDSCRTGRYSKELKSMSLQIGKEQSWSIEEIIKKYRSCKSVIHDGNSSDLHFRDIDFMQIWDPLITAYNNMREQGFSKDEILAQCRFVKASIVRGIKPTKKDLYVCNNNSKLVEQINNAKRSEKVEKYEKLCEINYD